MLQCVAVGLETQSFSQQSCELKIECAAVCYSVLQYVAVGLEPQSFSQGSCESKIECVAECCSVLQSSANKIVN